MPFQNADSDVMLARRILRDVKERGRDIDGIITQYLRFVKSSYDTYVLPSSKHADIIVPGQDNDTAKVLLAAHVQREIDARSLRFRDKLMAQGLEYAQSAFDVGLEAREPFFNMLKQTNQLQVSRKLASNLAVKALLTRRSESLGYPDRLAQRGHSSARIHLLCRCVLSVKCLSPSIRALLRHFTNRSIILAGG